MANKISIITTSAALEVASNALSIESRIAVDTEFTRKNSYFANLALLQIATPTEIYVIDPLQVNVSALKVIFENPSIIKVFHDPQQDLGILYHQFKILTKSVFDTQTAARWCNLHDQISYQHLCQKLLNIKLDKSLQNQDWTTRPLSPEMIEYAARDVKYLLTIQKTLQAEMYAYHNLTPANDGMAKFSDKSYYAIDFANIWQKIKFEERIPQCIKKIQMLAIFRENAAIESNLARQRILNDEDLLLISQELPSNYNSFTKLKIRHKLNTSQLKELLNICLGLKETNL